jgi:hypothetical protein
LIVVLASLLEFNPCSYTAREERKAIEIRHRETAVGFVRSTLFALFRH